MISNPNGMPQMSAAFAGWTQKITMVIINQGVVDDGFINDSEKKITFQGTIQPLSEEAIKLKPEGQRSFKWLDVHCMGKKMILKKDDKIIYDGQRYKVMAFGDWTLNNYSEYHICQDYQDGTV